jgi:phosphate transport system substrate-binding protein
MRSASIEPWLAVICLSLLFGLLGCAQAADKVWYSDLATARALALDGARAYQLKQKQKVTVKAVGTLSAIEAVSKGAADVVTVARSADPNIAAEQSLIFSPIAWDALVLIVHRNNQVLSLSPEQVRDIYRGRLTQWSQVGGGAGSINLYAVAGPLDGVEWSLRRLMFGYGGTQVAARRWYINTQQLEEAVAIDPLSMGVTLWSNIAGQNRLKYLMIGQVAPNAASLASGDYPLSTLLYSVTRRDSPQQRGPRGFAKDMFRFMRKERLLHTALHQKALQLFKENSPLSQNKVIREQGLASQLGFRFREPAALAVAAPLPPLKNGPSNALRTIKDSNYYQGKPLDPTADGSVVNNKTRQTVSKGLACRPKPLCA